MKIIRQIFIILLFYILGELLALGIRSLFPSIMIPGTILGLIVLLTLLSTKVLKLAAVDDVGSFLTANMAFFFIPAAVSVIEYFDILSDSILAILALLVTSTVLSFFAIALSVKIVVLIQTKYLEKKRGDAHE